MYKIKPISRSCNIWSVKRPTGQLALHDRCLCIAVIYALQLYMHGDWISMTVRQSVSWPVSQVLQLQVPKAIHWSCNCLWERLDMKAYYGWRLSMQDNSINNTELDSWPCMKSSFLIQLAILITSAHTWRLNMHDRGLCVATIYARKVPMHGSCLCMATLCTWHLAMHNNWLCMTTGYAWQLTRDGTV